MHENIFFKVKLNHWLAYGIKTERSTYL